MKRLILTLMGVGSLATGLAMMPRPTKALGTTDFTLNVSPASSVSVSIDPVQVGSNSIKQLGNIPSSASFYKTASINVSGVDSYAISTYLDCFALSGENKTKCEAGNLLTSSGDTLASVSSAKTFSTMNNEWGFRYNIGNEAQDPKDKYFTSLSTSRDNGFLQINGEEQIKIDNPTFSDNKLLTLGFGAKVDGDTPAGTYNGKVTVAVVANPVTGMFSGITTMQEMNHDICAAAQVNDTAYLTDIRDNKKYWVTKLEGGHCWMSQNLDLDVGVSGDNNVVASTNILLDYTNTDISSGNVTGLKTTINTADVSAASANNGEHSKYNWDQGLWVIKDPTATTACGNNSTGISACTAQFTDVSSAEWTAAEDPNFTNASSYKQSNRNNGNSITKTAGSPIDNVNKVYDAHYLIGNYYQYNTATVGSATNGDTNLMGIDAPDSLCPKGWKLPSTYTTEDVLGRSSFGYMLDKYGVAGSLTGTLNGKTTNLTLNPLFYVRSGHIDPGYKEFRNVGKDSHYWSARNNGGVATHAHDFGFTENTVYLSGNNWRSLGFSVRCVMY